MRIEFYRKSNGEILTDTNDLYFIMNNEVYENNQKIHADCAGLIILFEDCIEQCKDLEWRIAMNHIVCNKIKTPDGTVLISSTRHDYKTYKDANGKEYMVDGGIDYLRRNVHKEAPYEELSVYSDDPHEEVREVFLWGTYGPKGDQPLEYKPLKDLSANHIYNILRNCNPMPKWRRDIFKAELEYRNEQSYTT